MLSKERAYAVIDRALQETKGYEARVVVRSGTEALTRVANSEIHQNVSATSLDVTIVVTGEGKKSAVTTGLDSVEGLRRAAGEAIANLEYLPESEDQPPPVEEPAEIEAVELNAELERSYSAENRARLVGRNLATLEQGYRAFGALSYRVNLLAVGSSRGARRLAINNSVAFTALVASEKGGSGYAEAGSGRDGALDIPGAFARAYAKARLNCDPADLEPGSYTVILEPPAVADILVFLAYTGFSGKSVQDQASFLTGKLDKRVFDESITIVDDHNDPSMIPLPFDLEGTPRRKITIIEKGIARGVVHDLSSAWKEGAESTGHAVSASQPGAMPRHLVMAGGSRSLQEIIAGTDEGLLVTRFNYMNAVHPRRALLTALTRDGLFRIEAGRIAGAVRNMRFTESMLHALNNVEAVSSERQRIGCFKSGTCLVPALKIADFHFTGKSA